MWIDAPGGTKAPHWLEVQDPEGWYKAAVKWDGCIHLDAYHNEPLGEESTYVHICDLDEFIERLQALRETARRHFGSDWK